MDPQSSSYNLGGDTVPYNLTEIWPFPMNGSYAGGGASTSFQNNNVTNSLVVSMSMNMNVDLSVNRDHDPMVMEQTTNMNSSGVRRRREDDESAKGVSTSIAANATNEGDSKRLKTGGSNENRQPKANGEGNSVKPSEPPKQDYIHVRARRGQATDSHSLAERARREKISERMKILQDLVPGCNKVIGKALVLDEIINYIQSLQRQVEFLSMKLEAVNSRMDPGIEGFPSKDDRIVKAYVKMIFCFDDELVEFSNKDACCLIFPTSVNKYMKFGQAPFDSSTMAFVSQSSREYARGTSPEWLHMQIGGGFERTT